MHILLWLRPQVALAACTGGFGCVQLVFHALLIKRLLIMFANYAKIMYYPFIFFQKWNYVFWNEKFPDLLTKLYCHTKYASVYNRREHGNNRWKSHTLFIITNHDSSSAAREPSQTVGYNIVVKYYR